MKKLTISLAVLSLLSKSQVQGIRFLDIDFDEDENSQVDEITLDKTKTDIQQTIDKDNKKEENEAIQQLIEKKVEEKLDEVIKKNDSSSSTTEKSQKFDKKEIHNALRAKPMFFAQSQMQSDPIHGSSWESKFKFREYTPEMEFDYQTFKKLPEYELSDEVKQTLNSMIVAEAIVGAKMPGPKDPAEIAKDLANANNVPYYLAGDEDEDQDTVETRKSLLLAEQLLGRKFHLDQGDENESAKELFKTVKQDKISVKDLQRAGIDVSNKPTIQQVNPKTTILKDMKPNKKGEQTNSVKTAIPKKQATAQTEQQTELNTDNQDQLEQVNNQMREIAELSTELEFKRQELIKQHDKLIAN